MVKILFVSIILFGSLGCSTLDPLPNIIRITDGEIEGSGIPYVSPEYQGCSVQSSGNLEYDFQMTYNSDRCNITIINVTGQ